MLLRLSHTLSAGDPGWPDCPGLSIEPFTRMSQGASSDSSLIHLFNHYGTHMDAPAHFIAGGRRIAEFEMADFVFNRPVLLDIPKSFSEVVGPEDLEPRLGLLGGADLLLIRSGANRMRREAPERFGLESPSLSPSGAECLMDGLPGLRAIGVDWLSIASPAHIEDAPTIHRTLLGLNRSHHVFIIEDMDLEAVDPAALAKVWAIPLFVEGLDSGPVTVFAETAKP